jgi:RNA polymerase sigma factor (sigma-70 family)
MAATRSLSASLEQLGRNLLAGDLLAASDAELVGRFVERRDEAAFTALVRRYGTVVLGVCRRVLRHEQDAEDAFQATFLVFARDAANVRRAGAVGNWLYGVAHNVARKAKTTRHRREVKEREAAARPRPATPADAWDDLREILDGELHALPAKYRTPIVLCDLRGLTTNEAAAEVGCPPKTLGTRLSRGRSLLARRLTRRGVALPASALTAALAQVGPASASPVLVEATVRAALGFPAGTAVVSSPIVALTHGVSNVATLKTFKYAALVACGGVALIGLSAGAIHAVQAAHPAATARPADPAAPQSNAPARSENPLQRLHQFLYDLFHGDSTPAAAAADDKDAPALSGVWLQKDAGGNPWEVKLEFAAKKMLKISPFNKDDEVLILCEYTVDKDGLVKAKITEYQGSSENAKMKLMFAMPIGSEFSFKWKVKDDVATLDELKGEGDSKVEKLRQHIEGEYAKQK